MNTRLQTFQDFLATQSVSVPIWGFIFNLILAGGLSYVLGRVYVKYGGSLSNRSQFAKNFVLLSMTTALVIAIIKSSLALSLGLVGALSIVRFRAAIKEPEELTYLFLNIAIGLGFGAEQRMVTIVAFVLIIGVVWLKSKKYSYDENKNLYISLVSHDLNKISLDKVVEILNANSAAANLRRFDETSDVLEASFLVEYASFEQLKGCKEKLRQLDDKLKITFLDNQGLI